MAVKSGVSVNEFVRQINNELDSKQNVLTAGQYITIDENNVISADYEPASIYYLEFETTDFNENDQLVILASTHQVGTSPSIKYIQEYDPLDQSYSQVFVDFKCNLSGDITISCNPFNGRLLIDSPYSNSANLQTLVTDILSGSVD